MPTYPANSELVATTLFRTLGSSGDVQFSVGTTLPEDTKSWADGFVSLQVVGGSPDIYTRINRPLVQVDAYVPSINASKPQWGRANAIAEVIKAFAYDTSSNEIALDLGKSFRPARVLSLYPVSEPRRVTNDPAGHARYTFDVVLIWVEDTPAPKPEPETKAAPTIKS